MIPKVLLFSKTPKRAKALQLMAAAAVPLIAWLWLCAERPWRLGFFSDDWLILLHPDIGSARSFQDILQLVVTRPASAPLIWLVQTLAEWSPFRSQIINIAGLGLTAMSVGWLAKRLAAVAGVSAGSCLAGGSIAAATFICFPSNVGTYAWSVGTLAATPAVMPFCIGMALLVGPNRSRAWEQSAGIVLLAISHLSYEAFYFQELTILIAAYILAGTRPGRGAIILFAAVILLNVTCVVFNRLLPGGNHKSFNSGWWHIFIGGYFRIIPIYFHAVREHTVLFALSLTASLAFGTSCLARATSSLRAAGSLIVLTIGVGGAGILFAFAGYRLFAEGVMARTSIVVATYVSICMGLLSAGGWQQLKRPATVAGLSLGATSALLFTMALVSHARLEEWEETWDYEVIRLSRLPIDYGFKFHDPRFYVLIEDRNSIYAPASAPWEIAGAIAWQLYRRSGNSDRRMMDELWRTKPTHWLWFTAMPNWFTRWNGKTIEQGFCGSQPIYTSGSPELWVWNPAESSFTSVTPNWSHGCAESPR
jgi:hypothetical protein